MNFTTVLNETPITLSLLSVFTSGLAKGSDCDLIVSKSMGALRPASSFVHITRTFCLCTSFCSSTQSPAGDITSRMRTARQVEVVCHPGWPANHQDELLQLHLVGRGPLGKSLDHKKTFVHHRNAGLHEQDGATIISKIPICLRISRLQAGKLRNFHNGDPLRCYL